VKTYLLIIFLVILATGCTYKGHYEGSRVSFDYPIGWKCNKPTDLPGALIIVSAPSNKAMVIIGQEKANGSLEDRYLEHVQKLQEELSKYCYEKISNRTLTVDSSKAYELVYKLGCDQTQTRQQIRMIILQKGDYFYIIECEATPEDFNKENRNFDTIINSLHIL